VGTSGPVIADVCDFLGTFRTQASSEETKKVAAEHERDRGDDDAVSEIFAQWPWSSEANDVCIGDALFDTKDVSNSDIDGE
jgi:hypothetical protein